VASDGHMVLLKTMIPLWSTGASLIRLRSRASNVRTLLLHRAHRGGVSSRALLHARRLLTYNLTHLHTTSTHPDALMCTPVNLMIPLWSTGAALVRLRSRAGDLRAVVLHWAHRGGLPGRALLHARRLFPLGGPGRPGHRLHRRRPPRDTAYRQVVRIRRKSSEKEYICWSGVN
jgi:hypothetical protein